MRGLSWGRTWAIMRKEFTLFWRNKPMLLSLLLEPFLAMALFGYALGGEIKHLPIAVWDQDKSVMSRQLVDAYGTTGYFDTDYIVGSYDEIDALINGSQVRGALIIPAGYAERIVRRQPVTVQFFLDGSDPAVSATIESYATIIAQSHALSLVGDMGSLAGRIPSIDFRARIWYNPDMDILVFFLPGMIGMMIQWSTVAMTSMTIVRERETGTLEQLIATPIGRLELMIGKVAPHVLTAFVQVILSLATTTLLFGTPIQGSLVLLFALTCLFLVFSLGMGLLISAVSTSQMQASQMTTFIMLPMFMLSGFFSPIEPMPEFVQVIARSLPLTYYLRIVRGILIRGVGMEFLWQETAILALSAAAMIVASAVMFRKKL